MSINPKVWICINGHETSVFVKQGETKACLSGIDINIYQEYEDEKVCGLQVVIDSKPHNQRVYTDEVSFIGELYNYKDFDKLNNRIKSVQANERAWMDQWEKDMRKGIDLIGKRLESLENKQAQ